jgi:hypothetical protein
MGQLRTANKRHNRAILAEQARKVAAAKLPVKTEGAAETV